MPEREDLVTLPTQGTTKGTDVGSESGQQEGEGENGTYQNIDVEQDGHDLNAPTVDSITQNVDDISQNVYAAIPKDLQM